MKKVLFTNLLLALLLTACRTTPYVLTSVEPHRIEVTKALDASPDLQAAEFIKPYLAGVDSLRKPYVGQCEMCMTAGRPESLLSNWVADALVTKGEELGYKPDLGVCNVGGLRAAFPKDTVTRGDVFSTAPFENFLTVLKLRGADVLELFQNMAAVYGEGVSSSARLVITLDGRLKSAMLNGLPIQKDRIYTIATIDYLAEGNDKLYALKKAVERNDTRHQLRDILMERLQALDQQGLKATAQIEGRITIVQEGELPPKMKETVNKKVLNGTEQRIVINDSLDAVTPKPAETLLLVHTNDTHSCIEPLNPLLADTAQADKGGYLRRAALLQELRQQNPDLLLVDAGDFSQGSPYYTLYEGDVEVGLMNLMGYDAATIGNHEFDFGLENMARIFRLAKFPIVCCNYDFTETPVEGLVKPYVIVERSGLKIGILGVSPEMAGLVSVHNFEGVGFTDPIEAAQPVADYLKNEEKCDLVVCLSHLGWNIDGISDEELISGTRNIDIVIGGHSHTYFACPQVLNNLDGKPVLDNQMGKNARYVGTLLLNFATQ